MPWFNVDDGFANSKPVLRIPRRYRCAAIGLWTLAGSWSAKELTDGFIPDHAIEEFASTTAMAELLVRAELWKKVEGGWQFEGWSKWQKTKERVLAYRKREAEKKQSQRSGPKGAGQQDVSLGDYLGTEPGIPEGQVRESPMCPGQPLPPPSPNQILENLGGDVTEVSDPEPPRYCDDHPNDTDRYCPRCIPRRKAHDAWKTRNANSVETELEEKRRQKDAREKLQKNCPRCQGTNTYEDENGVVRPCPPHLEAVNA